MSVNKVILLGRLGADPELKTISNGNSVARFNLATSESWVDKEGQRQERTEWHRIVVWGRVGELAAKRLSKGKQVFIEGRIQTRTWEDQQGQKRYTTEVVANSVQFLEPSAERSEGSYDRGGYNNQITQDYGPEPSFDSSEEIPF